MNRVFITLLLTMSSAVFAGYGIDIVPKESFNASFFKSNTLPPNYKIGSAAERAIDSLLNLNDAEAYNPKYLANPQDSHLKKDITKIKLAIKFNSNSNIKKSDIIGFAPMGQWENGWTGVVEYFKNRALGVCGYFVNTIDYVQLNKSKIHYLNNKPSVIQYAKDSKKRSIVIITWYTELEKNQRNGVLRQELRCADSIIQKEFKTNVFAYAENLDKTYQELLK